MRYGRLMARPTPHEMTKRGTGFLTRTDLLELGHTRRSADAMFRRLPVVVIPGYRRPFVRVEDYLELLEDSTYRNDLPRVRGSSSVPA